MIYIHWIASGFIGLFSLCAVFAGVFLFFFFKQKTAYEMRISDWSSDVCSSDLGGHPADAGADGVVGEEGLRPLDHRLVHGEPREDPEGGHRERKIGRASCRERVCQYV